jgi:glycerophosphoryl diester phosphodiesterase
VTRARGDVPLALPALSHADQRRRRPLLDALEHGFHGVEVDVWLHEDKLLVGHDRHEISHDGVFEDLYLRPLLDRVGSGGQVYPGHDLSFLLLVELKSPDAVAGYHALHELLAKYSDMLDEYRADGTVIRRAAEVIVTGKPRRDLMRAQEVRWAACDGDMNWLEHGDPVDLVPLISARWRHVMRWWGHGPIPQGQRANLRAAVHRAHAQGRRFRFWGAPDRFGPTRQLVWRELVRAGVDYIATDRLTSLSTALRRHAQ